MANQTPDPKYKKLAPAVEWITQTFRKGIEHIGMAVVLIQTLGKSSDKDFEKLLHTLKKDEPLKGSRLLEKLSAKDLKILTQSINSGINIQLVRLTYGTPIKYKVSISKENSHQLTLTETNKPLGSKTVYEVSILEMLKPILATLKEEAFIPNKVKISGKLLSEIIFKNKSETFSLSFFGDIQDMECEQKEKHHPPEHQEIKRSIDKRLPEKDKYNLGLLKKNIMCYQEIITADHNNNVLEFIQSEIVTACTAIGLNDETLIKMEKYCNQPGAVKRGDKLTSYLLTLEENPINKMLSIVDEKAGVTFAQTTDYNLDSLGDILDLCHLEKLANANQDFCLKCVRDVIEGVL